MDWRFCYGYPLKTMFYEGVSIVPKWWTPPGHFTGEDNETTGERQNDFLKV